MSGFSAAQSSPSSRREITLTAGMLFITIVASMFLARDLLLAILQARADELEAAKIGLFTTVVFILIYGNLVYFVTRVGYFVRRMRHRPPAFEDLVKSYWDKAEPIVVLVPSYKEVPRTIRQTLLSAALQHHPNKRVVLLLDDPLNPQDRESAALLAAARGVPGEITAFLQEPKGLIVKAFRPFTERRAHGAVDVRAELRALLRVYDSLIAWMDRCVAVA